MVANMISILDLLQSLTKKDFGDLFVDMLCFRGNTEVYLKPS